MRRFNFKSVVVALCLLVSGNLFASQEKSPVICDISIDAGSDAVIYYGFGPVQCVDLTASITNGMSPMTILWSTGSNDDMIHVCPTSTTTYYVEVTDMNGCTATDSVTVCVVDVRCGRNLEKIKICHNGVSICVDVSAVGAHLRHGCSLGDCEGGCLLFDGRSQETEMNNKESEKEFSVFPNPANEHLNFTIPEYLIGESFHIIDMQGKIVLTDIFRSTKGKINVSELPQGIYLIRTSSGELIKWQKQ